MRVLNENRSSLLTESEKKPVGQMFQDSASRDLPVQIFRSRIRVGVAELGMLATEISSATLQTPSLFAIAIGSSVTWQKHNLLTLTWIKRDKAEEGRKKLAKLKAKIFNPKTKEERVARALKHLSEIKPIERLDKATWKSIVEEAALEDTYGD